MKLLGLFISFLCAMLSQAFVSQPAKLLGSPMHVHDATENRRPTSLFKQISQERRKQLGIQDDEDEYDLDFALDANTDPLISKIVAGSFILVMIALLTWGLIIPFTTDYGDGVCNPILNQGRC